MLAPLGARGAGDPLVRAIVHVPLDVPHALPGTRGPWYCTPGMLHVDTPIPGSLLASYERALRAHGRTTDHFGFGTWTVGAGPGSDVAYEGDDHIEVVARASDAATFVPAFVRRMRADLTQREALGEIVGVVDPAAGEPRTRIVVTLPPAQADDATLRMLHVIFGDRGEGGASQYAGERGTIVYSGVARAARARIEAALHRAGFAFATEPETFVTADAPPCA